MKFVVDDGDQQKACGTLHAAMIVEKSMRLIATLIPAESYDAHDGRFGTIWCQMRVGRGRTAARDYGMSGMGRGLRGGECWALVTEGAI